MLLQSLLLLTFVSSCHGNSLQFTLYQRKSECFYFEKAKGEKLEVRFAVADGISSLSFAVFGLDEELLHKKKSVKSDEYELIVNKTGDYAFCFTGHKLTSSVNVHFDYEPLLEGTRHEEAEKQLKADKKKFLNRVLNNIKFNEEISKKQFNMTEQFMMDVVRSHKEELVDGKPSSTMQNSMLYISILADSMLSSMKKHRNKLRSHYYMQENNRNEVDIYSTIITLGILLSACIQVIVVKSFFTGSLSLRIWKF